MCWFDDNFEARAKETEFLNAAAEGNLAAMCELHQEHGVDIHARDDRGRGAVFYCAFGGHHLMVVDLDMMGLDLGAPDREGFTPAWIAVKQGNGTVLKTLVDCGVDLKSRRYNRLFLRAAEEGRHSVLVMLSECGAGIHERDDDGRNAAHIAAARGHAHIIPALHSMGVDLDIQDNEGRTPASMAVQYGHATILTAISTCGVPMNGGLRQKVRINLFNEAVAKGDLDVMTALVEYGVDVHARCDKAGDTVAHTAALNDHQHVFSELQRLEVSLEFSDWSGESPAFIAAGKGDAECLRALRECGVDLLQCGTNDLSPLQAAKSKNNLDVVQYLEELLEATDTTAKQAENALLATLDAEERAKSNKVARNTSKKKKKDRKKSVTNNASGATTELAIASTEDKAANLELAFYGSKTPPRQVTCRGLDVVRS